MRLLPVDVTTATARVNKLRPELVAQVNAKIDEEVAKFVRELPQNVAKMLNGAMLSALGLRGGWPSSGSYEVDHSNGREGLIGSLVKEKAVEEAKKVVVEIASRVIEQFHKDQKVIVTILKEAESQYKQKLRENLMILATDQARADAQLLLNALGPVVFDKVPGVLGDVADPGCGSESETHEALLERLALEFISNEEIAHDAS
jgi:hypothetical protein